MISFSYPYLLWLMFLPFASIIMLPPIKNALGSALLVPFIDDIKNIKKRVGSRGYNFTNKYVVKSAKFLYLFTIWCLLVVGFARPQFIGEPHRLKTENRDIMLVIDISTSMLQPDFSTKRQRIDRLTAVKLVVGDFIEKRTEDKIGLVLFGTRAYLQSPLTFDKVAVKDILYNTDAGMAGNSTSIGDALGLALKNIKDDKNKQNKVIILLSDGESNDGSLSMAEAISLAEKEGIKVYTIGVGSEASFMGSIFGVRGNSFDEKSLKELANKTKGSYFKASDLSGLQKIYQEIDTLEPTDSQGTVVQEKRDLFYIPLMAALFLAIFLLFLPRSALK